MKLRNTLTLVVAFAAAAGGSQAASSVISWAYANGQAIPVNGAAGVVSATNWNLTQQAGTTDLKYSDGTSSLTTISLAGGFGAWGIGGVTAPDADGTYNKAIFDGYYNDNNGSTMTVGNIPFAQYDVYVYFSADVDGRNGTVSDGTTTYSFKTMGVAATSGSNAIFTQTTVNSGNPSASYAVFSGLTAASQTFNIATSTGMGFSGIQIVQVPEPGTAALGGIGLLALLRRRRG